MEELDNQIIEGIKSLRSKKQKQNEISIYNLLLKSIENIENDYLEKRITILIENNTLVVTHLGVNSYYIKGEGDIVKKGQ